MTVIGPPVAAPPILRTSNLKVVVLFGRHTPLKVRLRFGATTGIGVSSSKVAVTVGTEVAVGVLTAVLVDVAVAVAVSTGVLVGVLAGVLVDVAVAVAVLTGVLVGVSTGVLVDVAVAVAV